MKITFTDTIGVPEEYRPVPASKLIPDWYKNLESYIGGDKRPDGNASTTATAKRCMPIFDAISGGYLILTHADLWVSQKPDEEGKLHPYYEWAGHELSYPKWTNAWAIQTPPGYSSLFIPPLHRETPIIALSGVVDTDTYTAPVNFPFVLRDPKMDGLIPAGTPVMQVIPFKRDEWEMQIGSQEELIQQVKVTNKLRSVFFDSYKRQYRQVKEYK